MDLNINQLAQKSCQGARAGSVPRYSGREGHCLAPPPPPPPPRQGGAGLLVTPRLHKRLWVPSTLPPHPKNRWSPSLYPAFSPRSDENKSQLLFPISQATPFVSLPAGLFLSHRAQKIGQSG